MPRVVNSFSYAQGSPVDQMITTLRRDGKNVSEWIGNILEHHHSLYDQNIQLELEFNEIKYKYGKVCNAARSALSQSCQHCSKGGGDEWELYFPPYEQASNDGENYGIASTIHFRRVE